MHTHSPTYTSAFPLTTNEVSKHTPPSHSVRCDQIVGRIITLMHHSLPHAPRLRPLIHYSHGAYAPPLSSLHFGVK